MISRAEIEQKNPDDGIYVYWSESVTLFISLIFHFYSNYSLLRLFYPK
jgi:hypothetical protein